MTEPSPPQPPTPGPLADWAAARGRKWRAHLPGMEATLRPLDAPLLAALQLDAPCRIAEVGCGGGGTALELARRAPPGSVVHGFDLSPALVEAARARTPPGAQGVAFTVADVATTPLPAAPYDRLASRLGVMFFADPAAAFARLARWLAPRGRFAFVVWGPVDDNPWMTTTRDVVATIVDLPPPDPAGPGPFRYARVEPLLALLEGAGLGDLDVRCWRGDLALGGGLPAAEAARFALSAFSSYAEQLEAAGGDAHARACEALARRLAAHEVEGVVRMAARAHVVTGARGA